MYRFFKTQGTPMQSVCFISNQGSIQYSTQICSFCKIYHQKFVKMNFFPIRQLSTTINSAELSVLTKKRSRPRRKYMELLEVKDDGSTNKRAAVQKITAANLTKLVDTQNNTINKLRKTKEANVTELNSVAEKNVGNIINKEYHGSTNINTTDKTFHSITTESLEFYKQDVLNDQGLDDYNKFSLKGITVESKPALANINISCIKDEEEEDLDHSNGQVLESIREVEPKQQGTFDPEQELKKYDVEYYHNIILSHLDVYVSCGVISRAERALILYRKTCKDKCISPYNIVLDAHAMKGNVFKVLQTLKWVKTDSLQPDPQTFAALYECIGKMTNLKKKMELLNGVKQYMDKCKISFLDILNESKFRVMQRDHVIKAIKLLEPDFKIVYYPPNLEYDCKLLKFKSLKTTPPKDIPSYEKLKELAKEQIQLELKGEVDIVNISVPSNVKQVIDHNKEKIAEFEKNAVKTVEDAFEMNLKYLKQAERNTVKISAVLSPFLECLPKEVYINTVMHVVRKLAEGSEIYSPSLTTLHVMLGSLILNKYEIHSQIERGSLQKTVDVYMKYLDWYANDRKGLNARCAWESLRHEADTIGVSTKQVYKRWPPKIRAKVGKFLYNIILNEVKVNVEQTSKVSSNHQFPAFYTVYRNKGKFLMEQIKPHPYIAKLYQDNQPDVLKFETTLLPTICPPRPWTDVYSGGFLISKSTFMRMIETAQWQQQRNLLNKPNKQLYPTMDTLNQLGTTPWRINTRILDIIMKVFQDGGSVDLKVPQPPSALEPPPTISIDASPEDKKSNMKKRMEHASLKKDMYSLWCDTLYRLSIANHFRNNVLWLPHNLDFRGRVYPLPPHLHHMSSDLGRSILMFAEGKPLGPNGFDWLKIHIINLTTLKKSASVEERLEFANECLDDIVDSAENPLTGRMWWMKSEDPWQTLAACMEVADVLKSPNPEEFVSRLPIHQDGSCNGLQHYAALGRDTLGAKAVNLSPCEKPQDVYSVVAQMVEKFRKEDEEKGLPVAKVLNGFVTRKVIKQTVMTTVYGVTKYGAESQIKKQLKALPNFPEEHYSSGSIYLARKTFESLGTMFTGARNIQEWLINCANIITKKYNQNVQWITPTGLPVLQAYNKKKLQSALKDRSGRLLLKPDTLKQRNAFPPNFIHSLDATHMLLTSLYSESDGITFVSVHDCYWTHVCTVDRMNQILRQQFVTLHSEPILEDISKFFIEYYGSMPIQLCRDEYLDIFAAVPEKGDFDLENVLTSTYFFN